MSVFLVGSGQPLPSLFPRNSLPRLGFFHLASFPTP